MGDGALTETAGRLLLYDLVLSFLWTFWSSILKLLVLSGSLYIISLLFFSWLGLRTHGGCSNPLVLLSAAMNGDTSMFPRTVAGRILAQVAGSIVGVGLAREMFPQVADCPCLNVDIPRGALAEGLISFSYVAIYLGAKRKYPKNFVLRASITAVSRLILRLLVGGCMNPASHARWSHQVFFFIFVHLFFLFLGTSVLSPGLRWAFSRGDHITKEHLFVYWLAPLEGTLLGFWVSSLLVEGPLHKVKRRTRNQINAKYIIYIHKYINIYAHFG
ncbi:unnamed protein product [Spirodela intermedia]|uniref:Uncharacterized protein n=1 Tax=Spirodela intermedia TaxID=51605 RepID=A0A7I8IVB3_SPIIN|nr:unnamed protein product [Spirodela intermedia]CAA6661945.1 unnamed protein product [Spirodela intermedia]